MEEWMDCKEWSFDHPVVKALKKDFYNKVLTVADAYESDQRMNAIVKKAFGKPDAAVDASPPRKKTRALYAMMSPKKMVIRKRTRSKEQIRQLRRLQSTTMNQMMT
jgi:hypothetical protein